MLRRFTKPHELIKRAKTSYSIATLEFRKFSCGTYRIGLNRGPQSWGTPSTSKSTYRVSLIPYVGNPHFIILLHRVWYLKNLFILEDNRSSFSWVSLKSEPKDGRPQTVVLFCLQKIVNKHLTSSKLKISKFLFNVKQLKMSKLIKYIWQMIISTSNATLEVLGPVR